MNNENNESEEAMEALFEEAALILSDKEGSTPPWLVRPLLPIIMERLWPPL